MVNGKSTGATEQRTGWVLEDVIQEMEEPYNERKLIGWKSFYSKYFNN